MFEIDPDVIELDQLYQTLEEKLSPMIDRAATLTKPLEISKRHEIENELVNLWMNWCVPLNEISSNAVPMLYKLENSEINDRVDIGVLRQPFDVEIKSPRNQHIADAIPDYLTRQTKSLRSARKQLEPFLNPTNPRSEDSKKRPVGLLPWQGDSAEWQEMVQAIKRQSLLLEPEDRLGRACLHNLTQQELETCKAEGGREPTTEQLLAYSARKLVPYRNEPITIEELLSDAPPENYLVPPGVPATEKEIGIFLYDLWKAGKFKKSTDLKEAAPANDPKCAVVLGANPEDPIKIFGTCHDRVTTEQWKILKLLTDRWSPDREDRVSSRTIENQTGVDQQNVMRALRELSKNTSMRHALDRPGKPHGGYRLRGIGETPNEKTCNESVGHGQKTENTPRKPPQKKQKRHPNKHK